MRFLIDRNLPPLAVRWFTARGLDAVHVLDVGLHEAGDDTVVLYAAADQRIIVTKDKDKDYAALPLGSPPVVLVSISNTSNKALIATWTAAWPTTEAALRRGERLVVVDEPR